MLVLPLQITVGTDTSRVAYVPLRKTVGAHVLLLVVVVQFIAAVVGATILALTVTSAVATRSELTVNARALPACAGCQGSGSMSATSSDAVAKFCGAPHVGVVVAEQPLNSEGVLTGRVDGGGSGCDVVVSGTVRSRSVVDAGPASATPEGAELVGPDETPPPHASAVAERANRRSDMFMAAAEASCVRATAREKRMSACVTLCRRATCRARNRRARWG